ncbi:fluoride efflux transporter FluC [Fictibacillus iocasae]|uniref:Fluoride-specific ion channel FluC n=1 Tax=Fictibacillus iocasae TaxID=2715437 RepID=A0ABW2NYQ6_9BACL
MSSFAAALGGAIGALIRYYAANKWNRSFPYGTLAVNILGSFCLGTLAAAEVPALKESFWGAGVLGGLTTFSTFQLEAVFLLRQSKATGWFYVMFTLLAGIGACAAGYVISS